MLIMYRVTGTSFVTPTTAACFPFQPITWTACIGPQQASRGGAFLCPIRFPNSPSVDIDWYRFGHERFSSRTGGWYSLAGGYMNASKELFVIDLRSGIVKTDREVMCMSSANMGVFDSRTLPFYAIAWISRTCRSRRCLRRQVTTSNVSHCNCTYDCNCT